MPLYTYRSTGIINLYSCELQLYHLEYSACIQFLFSLKDFISTVSKVSPFPPSLSLRLFYTFVIQLNCSVTLCIQSLYFLNFLSDFPPCPKSMFYVNVCSLGWKVQWLLANAQPPVSIIIIIFLGVVSLYLYCLGLLKFLNQQVYSSYQI